MTRDKSREEDLTTMLGATAKKQAEEAERAAQSGGADRALRPLDEAERAAIARSLFGAEVVALRPRSRARTKWIAGLALAAAIAIAFIASLSVERALPRYHLQIASGGRDVRSSTVAANNIYDTGSRFELIFQPETPVDEKIPVQVTIARTGEPAQPITVPIEYSADGSIRIRGFIGRDIIFPPGDLKMIISIGAKSETQIFEYSLRSESPSP